MAAALAPDLDDRVCKDVPTPPRGPFPREKLFQAHNGLPDLDALRDHFCREGRLDFTDATDLVRRAGDLLRREPNLLRLSDPITVCGDVHGQFFDLLRLFEVGGDPEHTQYLFLGDYVDRGCFSTECVFYLYALKLTYPNRFFMLRGNHECRQLTSFFNFKDECLFKYDVEIYDEIMNSFDTLPLAAIINEKFLCTHGGLSPEIRTLRDIEVIDRFMEVPRSGPMCDLLWSDPVEEVGARDEALAASDEAAPASDKRDGGADSDEDEGKRTTHFAHNSTRQCSYYFGVDAVDQFLSENNLTSLIRAHEAQLEGYKMQMVNEATGIPRVITIFSAPNYCDVYKNKAACLEFDNNLLNIRQFVCSPHPYYLPNFMDVFEWSLPFVAEKVTDILQHVVGPADDTNSDEEALAGAAAAAGADGAAAAVSVGGFNPEQMSLAQAMLKKRGGTLRQKVVAVAKLARVFAILRQERENCGQLKELTSNHKLPFGLLREGKDAIKKVLTSFEEARRADRVNEKRPTEALAARLASSLPFGMNKRSSLVKRKA